MLIRKSTKPAIYKIDLPYFQPLTPENVIEKPSVDDFSQKKKPNLFILATHWQVVYCRSGTKFLPVLQPAAVY